MSDRKYGETRTKIGPARGGTFKTPPRRMTYQPKEPRHGYCLDTVNFEEVLSDLSDEESAGLRPDTSFSTLRLSSEGNKNPEAIIEAVQLSLNARYEEARNLAEAVQQTDPTDSTSIFVSGAECEARQDWSEAARFFLVGMGHNAADGSMEHGFQTNVDMLRTQRHKWNDRETASKWDDVLTFRPRAPRLRPPSPDEKPPWWRLGPWYEELLDDPGHLVDHLGDQGEADTNVMEIRRLIYENLEFLDKIYAYYRDDLNDNFGSDQSVPGAMKHDGHEDSASESPMRLNGWRRLLKECKIAFGDVKQKLPVAVFDRVAVTGRLYNHNRLSANPSYEIAVIDPHGDDIRIGYYEFIEALIRSSSLKLRGTRSGCFEMLINEYLKPFAMRKQTDKSFLDYRTAPIANFFEQKLIAWRMKRLYEHFILTYKQNRLKSNVVGQNDVTMSFNHAYSCLEKCDMYDPQLTPKKLCEVFCKVTLDSDLLSQEHPNNQNSEMVFHEFLELIMRIARIKKNDNKKPTIDCLSIFVDELFTKAGRLVPGKW